MATILIVDDEPIIRQLFQKVLEKDTPLHLYNLNGHAFSSDMGGGLLQTRI